MNAGFSQPPPKGSLDQVTATFRDSQQNYLIFVSASHKTGLETRSMTQRSIIVRIYGRGWSSMSQGLNPAGLCWSSAHFVQCGPDEPSCSWTQIRAQARMPDYYKLDSKVQFYTRVTKVSVLQLAHPKVAQLKSAMEHYPSGQTVHWVVSKITHFIIVSNVFMRNGTYSLLLTGRVYNSVHYKQEFFFRISSSKFRGT